MLRGNCSRPEFASSTRRTSPPSRKVRNCAAPPSSDMEHSIEPPFLINEFVPGTLSKFMHGTRRRAARPGRRILRNLITAFENPYSGPFGGLCPANSGSSSLRRHPPIATVEVVTPHPRIAEAGDFRVDRELPRT